MALTPYEVERVTRAKQHGFALFAVQGEHSPSFVYTVGMAQHALTDLLVFVPSTEDLSLMGGLITNMAQSLIEFRAMHPDAPIEQIDGLQKLVTDPSVVYTFSVLDPGLNEFALRNYACRAWFFSKLFGTPRICELQYEDMITVEQLARQSLTRSLI